MSQLVRMPDQFTPGRGARAAATPTCSSCCCCCCCVVSLITSSVVLPVSASRAVHDHGRGDRAAAGSPDAPPRRSPASRVLGYVLLALTPLATFGGGLLVGVLLESLAGGLVTAAVVGIGFAYAGDQLVGRPRAGVSVALLVLFAGLFVLEVFASVALLEVGGVAYTVAAPVVLLAVLGGYLLLTRPR
jgi:hypothetical protein